jgi:hypothetical protein
MIFQVFDSFADEDGDLLGEEVLWIGLCFERAFCLDLQTSSSNQVHFSCTTLKMASPELQ